MTDPFFELNRRLQTKRPDGRTAFPTVLETMHHQGVFDRVGRNSGLPPPPQPGAAENAIKAMFHAKVEEAGRVTGAYIEGQKQMGAMQRERDGIAARYQQLHGQYSGLLEEYSKMLQKRHGPVTPIVRSSGSRGVRAVKADADVVSDVEHVSSRPGSDDSEAVPVDGVPTERHPDNGGHADEHPDEE